LHTSGLQRYVVTSSLRM